MSLTPYVHLALGALVDAGPGDHVDLPDEARGHLERVLRLRAGADLVVADGQGREATAHLAGPSAELVGAVVHHPAPDRDLHLVQALAKGRKTDDIVRSATELGVDRITLVASQRSVTKVDASKQARAADRWRSVARAAAEQSRRPWLPVVEGPVSVDALVASWTAPITGVIGHPAAKGSITPLLGDIASMGDCQVVAAIGPEGGWDDGEVAALETAGLIAVRLGPSVLRTEHAGHALCAILAFVLGRLD